jgi:hypothetical protein
MNTWERLKTAVRALDDATKDNDLGDQPEISDVVGYFNQYERELVPVVMTQSLNDTFWMNEIHGVLNGHEWEASTIEEVAEIVEKSGRKITGPNVIDDVSIHFGAGTESDTIAEMFTHHHGHIIDIETIKGPFTAKLVDTDPGGLEVVLFGPADIEPGTVVDVPDDAPTIHLTWEEVGAITIH